MELLSTCTLYRRDDVSGGKYIRLNFDYARNSARDNLEKVFCEVKDTGPVVPNIWTTLIFYVSSGRMSIARSNSCSFSQLFCWCSYFESADTRTLYIQMLKCIKQAEVSILISRHSPLFLQEHFFQSHLRDSSCVNKELYDLRVGVPKNGKCYKASDNMWQSYVTRILLHSLYFSRMFTDGNNSMSEML